jgi:TRAP-type mannitol/chloroaromatic compound transport system substrate-binding protein
MIAADFTWQQAVSYFYVDSTNAIKDANDLYAKFNIQRIAMTCSETEVEVMSNKKLEKPADFKGITFRGAGYSPLIIQEPEFGGSGVILATADVYTSLQTKVIDACEVGNAFSNYGSGYQEVTKYWSFPAIHQLCQTSGFFVNMDSWKTLPADIQMIIQMVGSHYQLRSWAFSHVESAKIIPVLQDKYGIVIYRESPELQALWKKVAWRIADSFAAKLPEFAAMWKSHKDFMNMLQPYEVLQTVTYGTAP